MRALALPEAEEQVVSLIESLPPHAVCLHSAWHNVARSKHASHEETATECYTLVVACQALSGRSALLDAFADVLRGKASVHTLTRCAALLHALRRVLRQAESLRLPDCEPGHLPACEVPELLRRLFPGQTPTQAHEMLECVQAASGPGAVSMAELAHTSLLTTTRAATRGAPAAGQALGGAGTAQAAGVTLPGPESGHPGCPATAAAAPARTLRQVALTQHLGSLKALRKQITVALSLLQRQHAGTGGRAHVYEVTERLETLPTLDPRRCSALVAAGLKATGVDEADQSADVDVGALADAVLAAAPLRVRDDFDAAAALSWLVALQASAAGTSSAAGLPDVA